MKIITTNPILTEAQYFEEDWTSAASGELQVRTEDPIIGGTLKEFRDEFVQNESGFNGLTVLTSDPILTKAEYYEEDWTSAASGATRRARRTARQKERAKKQASGNTFGNKLKSGLGKIADSGIIDTLIASRQNNNSMGDNDLPIVDIQNPQSQEPMSTTMKVVIVVGVLVAIGGATYYFINKKK